MKKKNQTTYAYPVEKICGKISRHSKIVHACTASGKQITYLQGERDLNAHPVSADENGAKELFARRSKVANARQAKNAPTYQADMAAYHEQYASGYKSFAKYIWSLVMAEITE